MLVWVVHVFWSFIQLSHKWKTRVKCLDAERMFDPNETEPGVRLAVNFQNIVLDELLQHKLLLLLLSVKICYCEIFHRTDTMSFESGVFTICWHFKKIKLHIRKAFYPAPKLINRIMNKCRYGCIAEYLSFKQLDSSWGLRADSLKRGRQSDASRNVTGNQMIAEKYFCSECVLHSWLH